MKLVIGIAIGILALPLAATLVVWTGSFDMSATRPPTKLEQLVGGALADRAVARRAPRGKNPVPLTREVLSAGLAHYREDCVVCHGAPGIPSGEAGKGLNPPAPDLASADSQESSDGELYQVIAHGIRMTGMPAWLPTHTEREIWELVAFVRHLPQITPGEKRELATGQESMPRDASSATRGEPPGGHP